MTVATIVMAPEEARARLQEYRAGVHRKADAEWEQAAVAYERLAQGTPLVVLSQVIADSLCDVKGRPLLAIARADRKQVECTLGGSGNRVTFDTQIPKYRQRDAGRKGLQFTYELTRPAVGVPLWTRGYALVPMVPPNVLQRRQLRDHFVLWDVVAWADSRIGAKPPVDPYLLERVADDLYAIVGEWDLTEVEQAVMRDRAR
jgi:hypothetical protein